MSNHSATRPAENLPATRIDLKAAGVYLNQYLVHNILMLIKKVKSLHPQAESIDVSLTAERAQPSYPKIMTVRFGIPASEDVVASESGKRWKVVLKNLEKKLVRQLEQRKAALLT